MPLANTISRYGGVAKCLHWLIALLVLTAIPLGLFANGLPHDSDAALAFKTRIFSLHKTLGVAIFLTALLRLLWAMTQVKPAPLHAARRVETFLAEAVHWSLYLSLLAVPLSGWLQHAATTGFAPILWSFGQSLPFVPKDPRLAELFAALHGVFTKVLAASILLHLLGALKHALLDRDATLRRMWFGSVTLPEPGRQRPSRAPLAAALAIWLAALAFGLARAPEISAPSDGGVVPAEGAGWQVSEGTLAITVRQIGAKVDGRFAAWTAAIEFDPETGRGDVEVQIDIASLTLGSVTLQALGPEFLDAGAHPVARFRASIRPEDGMFFAEGMLTLRGVDLPVTLYFRLDFDGKTARMEGETRLDRRDFGIGARFADESQIGFPVDVSVRLTAVWRAAGGN